MADDEIDEEVLDEIQAMLELGVRAGLESISEVCEGTVASMLGSINDDDEEEDEALLEAAVGRLLPGVLRALHVDQEAWPERTDCDRITDAFASLAPRGILCGQGLGWSQGDGADLTMVSADKARARGETVRGYAFFHEQDIEHALAGRGVMVAFGRLAANADLEPDASIGEEVAAALRAEGLRVRWDGNADQRIAIDMLWQRRRPGGNAVKKRSLWQRMFGGG